MKKTALLWIALAAFLVGSSPQPAYEDPRLDTMVSEIQGFLDELEDYQELSLAVSIAKDGVPVLERAYGLANRSFNVPNAIDTKLNLASMNKMFTAVAVMQLVQDGRLGLEDSIGSHIPDFPNPEVRGVTVFQLLTHTAGMGNIFGDRYGNIPRNKYQKVEDYFPLFVDDPLRFSPGSRYEYSNAGYIVLGYLIERVTGQDYYTYVRDYIFLPAGMNNTDCYDVQYPIPNLAVGYTKSGSVPGKHEYKTTEYMKMTKGGPAGGGYSTVGDLIRFGDALFGNRLLNREYTELATTGKVPVDDTYQGGQYCFGFLEQKINGHRVVGHSGNLSGIRASFRAYPDEGISFAILSNFDRDQGAEELEYFIREKIEGKTDFTETYLRTKKFVRDIETKGYSYCIGEYYSGEDELQMYEGIINARGHVLIRYRDYDKAIDLFKSYTVAFPNSAYAYDGLGAAYVKTGKKDEAVKCYLKALEINPEFERSADALRELGVIK